MRTVDNTKDGKPALTVQGMRHANPEALNGRVLGVLMNCRDCGTIRSFKMDVGFHRLIAGADEFHYINTVCEACGHQFSAAFGWMPEELMPYESVFTQQVDVRALDSNGLRKPVKLGIHEVADAIAETLEEPEG